MRFSLLLYNFLLFAVALDATASTLAAWYIFRLRQRMGWYIALAFTGVAVEATAAVITMGFAGSNYRPVAWAVAVRILIRLFKAATMVTLLLYLLGYINGDKRNVE